MHLLLVANLVTSPKQGEPESREVPDGTPLSLASQNPWRASLSLAACVSSDGIEHKILHLVAMFATRGSWHRY